MAWFKELTLDSGEKAIINLDEVKAMQRFGTETRISFAKDYAFNVRETPAEIVAESRDAGLTPSEIVALREP
jgi:hypothetical protein|nr:hypothetical protein [Bradyrhizobium sp.]